MFFSEIISLWAVVNIYPIFFLCSTKICGKTYDKLLYNLPNPIISSHQRPPGTHTHKLANNKKNEYTKNPQHPAEAHQETDFQTLFSCSTYWAETKRNRGPPILSLPNPYPAYISYICWQTGSHIQVADYNCLCLSPFRSGNFSHSQEINIKYCLQHNILAENETYAAACRRADGWFPPKIPS